VVLGNVGARGLGHGDEPADVLADTRLHACECVPTAFSEAFEPGASVVELELTVDGDGVMDDAQHGEAELALDCDVAVAQAAVVDNEVEVVGPLCQGLVGANGERQWFGEITSEVGPQLGSVGPVFDLPEARDAAWVLVVVDLEAGELVELDSWIEVGVGGAAKDFDVGPKVGKGLTHFSDVDALATHVWLAAVGKHGDAQWTHRRIGDLGLQLGRPSFDGPYSVRHPVALPSRARRLARGYWLRAEMTYRASCWR